MALSHNVFIRGLNSIYLQAPNLKPGDHSDFINYCKCWCDVLNNHHKMEEATVFPKIEEITGEKGIMDVNVEQHRRYSPSSNKTLLTSHRCIPPRPYSIRKLPIDHLRLPRDILRPSPYQTNRFFRIDPSPTSNRRNPLFDFPLAIRFFPSATSYSECRSGQIFQGASVD
jgi:hypothetical protein